MKISYQAVLRKAHESSAPGTFKTNGMFFDESTTHTSLKHAVMIWSQLSNCFISYCFDWPIGHQWTNDILVNKAVRPSSGHLVSKLERRMPTFQALSAVQTIAIRHASSPITTCSLHLVALMRSLRLVVAFTSHVLSLGQQQTATDHSPLAVWSPQRANSDAGCQEEARARAPRWYNCLSLVPMGSLFFFLLL